MVLTVTEDTPADMLAGSMELLVQLPRDHHLHTQRVTVQRSTPMMDLLVQIATAHKLAASNYTLQAIGERGSVLPHQPNTPIGALDALQVKLLPKQSTFAPRKAKPANQPFETTFRLQVHLPRNQLYVSRVSPKMNLGEILEEVCREKNLDKNKYELRHPVNLEETLDLSLSLQDYHLQEVTLYTKQGRTLGSALSSQDIMALQRQEERRRQQAKQSVFGFIFKKSKENSLSTDSLEGRSVSPARSDETGRSASPLQPPARPQRKRRPAPKPPVSLPNNNNNNNEQASNECSNGNAACKDKVVISHSRNSSDSSGYHEASVLSDNPDSAARLPETLPRRNKAPTAAETSRKLAQTSQSSKSLGNIAVASGGSLNRAVSTTSLSSTGLRKKRAAPPPPVSKPLSSAISTQALERIDDSEESLTSDMDPSKPPSDIGVPSKASSDIEDRPKANSDIGVSTKSNVKTTTESTVSAEKHHIVNSQDSKVDPVAAEKDAKLIGKGKDTNLAISEGSSSVEEETAATPSKVEPPRVDIKRESGQSTPPLPKPRKTHVDKKALVPPEVPKRRLVPPLVLPRTLSKNSSSSVEASPSSTPVLVNTPRTASDSNVISTSDTTAATLTTSRTTTNVNSHENDQTDTTGSSISKEIDDIRRYKDSTNVNNDKTNEMNVNGVENVHATKSPSGRKEFCKKFNTFTRLKPNFTIKHAKSLNDIYSECSPKEDRKLQANLSPLRSKKCTIISTIPKCNHINSVTENVNIKKSPIQIGKSRSDGKFDEFSANSRVSDGKHEEYLPIARNVAGARKNIEEDAKTPKRMVKVFRCPSELKDFEVDSFKRQKRHLTCESEDITFALNMNVASNNSLMSEEQNANSERENQRGEAGVVGLSGTDKGLLDTDALLQKVSDTLSSSLPATSTIPQAITTSNCALPDHSTVDIGADRKDFASNEEMQTLPVPESFVDKEKESTKEALLKNNAENLTISSQQDTSDYVSAVGDDLSITDWEYQLPAPPSAFRDTNSPVLDTINTESLHSVKDTFKQSTPITHFSNSDDTVDYCDRNGNDIVAYDDLYDEPLLKKDVRVREALVQGNGRKCDPKKEVISELENRIESGTLSPVHREAADCKKNVSQQVSTPKLAPVDNTLSNFIITTYARQKSVDIFEESSVRRDNFVPAKSTEEKVEERSNTLKNVNRSESLNHHQSRGIADSKKSELKISHHLSESQQKTNEMQRAKGGDFKSAHEEPRVNGRDQTPINNSPNNNVSIRKSKSIGNLHTDVPRNNDKFSQWRENILKRQEEPTKEKQLQSLQVLKSILPQLKNAQRAEENVSKDCVGQEEKKNRYDATSNERSKGDSPCESRVTEEADNKNCSSKEPNVKRYTYTGPPAISLGSWAERPSIKVQIKVDSDYKLGRNNAATGATTVVNLNQSKERKDDCRDVNANSVVNGTPKMTAMNVPSNDSIEREGKVNYLFAEKRETDELTRKLITHTTAAGFKKPTLNKVNSIRSNSTSTKDVDRPMVTQIELKKVDQEKEESREDSNRCVIDTTPLNFNELTKAFGQDVNCRAKPKRLLTNRHSDYYSNLPETIQRATESSNRHSKNQKSSENGSSSRLNVLYKNHTASNGDQNNVHIEPKKFTSIVGINSQNQQNHVSLNGNVSLKNNVNNCRMNTPAPVVKGFKIQASLGESKAMNASQNNSPLSESNKETKRDTEAPKAPTMPVIMGVTLKSTRARPKSMPITVDPRDMLLESIRNFGGREKLKNATERC